MLEAHKDDAGKLRYDLIPTGPLAKLAEVYTLGAVKYGDENWKQGIEPHRLVAAMMRHVEAYRQGVRVDPDDGQHPLASVAWYCFALMWYERPGIGVDDRRP